MQRLFELRTSHRHIQILLSEGGVEYAFGHYPFMILLHLGWFVAMFLEVVYLNRPFIPILAGIAAAGVLMGNIFRYSAMHALGTRWCTRIVVLPGVSPVRTGIYRYLRHPNYIGVCLEIACIPLLHTAYLTSITFSILNAFLLLVRIRAEEKALCST